MKPFYLTLFFNLFIFLSSHSQIWDFDQKVVGSDRADGDTYGGAVSISDSFAIVGAYQEDENASGLVTMAAAGSAYIIKRNNTGTWTQQQKIVALDRAVGDNFGWSVAISGNYAVVGAPRDSKDEYGLNPLTNSGSAYIFEKSGSGVWIQVKKIVAADRGNNDFFGWSVSISNNYIAIGAYKEDENEVGGSTLLDAGSVYIFERNLSGIWSQTQKIVTSDRAGSDQFGNDVSIFENTLCVGAYTEDHDQNGLNNLSSSGSTYIFDRNLSGIWSQSQKIVASDRAISDFFGCSVSLWGNYIIVGAQSEDHDIIGGNSISNAGSAYIFEKNASGIWNQVNKIVSSDRDIDDQFGMSVSITNGYALVGTFLDDENQFGSGNLNDSGSSYLFKRNSNGTWNQTQKIISYDRETSDYFAYDVALWNNYAIIGAPWEDENPFGLSTLNMAGSVYLYSTCENTSNFININSCNNYFWPTSNQTYTSSGNYQTIVPNSLGCDSIITLNLTINSPNSSQTNIIACESFTWTNGITYNNSGIYSQTLTNNNSCDSVATLNLTITQPTSSITLIETCGPYTWTDGIIYSSNGSYYQILNNSNGCDSIAELNLIIHTSSTSIDSIVSCSNSYTWIDGNTYFSDNTISTYNLPNSNGCDSIVTLNLTFSPNTTSEININTLDSYTWPQNGQTYTQSGTYTSVISNEAGCDSTITLNLTLNYSGIQELKENINVYPNPTFSALTINADWIQGENYRIIDFQGREILNGVLRTSHEIIDLKNLARGQYILKIGWNDILISKE